MSEVSAPPSASLRDERSREAVPSPSISNMKIWPSSLAVKRGGSVCVWACAGMGGHVRACAGMCRYGWQARLHVGCDGAEATGVQTRT